MLLDRQTPAISLEQKIQSCLHLTLIGPGHSYL